MNAEVSRLKTALRRAARFAWIYALYASGALALAKLCARRGDAILVLTFHRVLGDEEYQRTSSLPGMVVRERTFGALIQYLAGSAAPVDLRQPDPFEFRSVRQRVAITFDDGWIDTGKIAFPIARSAGFPMAVFVCPGLVGRTAPFWPERYAELRRGAATDQIASEVEQLKHAPANERERLVATLERKHPGGARFIGEPNAGTMSWDQLQILWSAGVCIGSHTDTHQIMTNIPLGAVDREVGISKQEIESRFDSCTAFAYPNGDYSVQTVQVVARHGYRFAFTTRPGLWRRTSDSLAVPRVNIAEFKITGPRGRFSRAAFEYSCFLKPMLQNIRKPAARP